MVDTSPRPARTDSAPDGGLSLQESVAALRSYAANERRRLLTAGLLLLVSGAIGLTQPLVVHRVLDGSPPARGAGASIAVLVVLVLLGGVVSALGHYQLTAAAEGVVLTARRRLTSRILRLPMTAFRSQTPGDLLARVTGDTTLLRQVVLQTLVQSVTGLIMVLGALVMMSLLDPVLLGASVLAILVLFFLVSLVMPRIRRASMGAQNSIGGMGHVLDRALTAFTTVKAFGAEEFETRRVSAAAEEAYRYGVTRGRWDSIASATASLSIHMVFLIVLGIGGLRVSSGDISVATMIAFLLYVLYLAEPVMSLVAIGAYFQTGRAAIQRVGEVTALPPEPPPADPRERTGRAWVRGPAPTDTRTVTGTTAAPAPAVVFDAVSFTYPGSTAPVLRSFSLEVPAVGLTALVGPSGAGKTTALSLIERFYEPDAGTVRLDGIDIRDRDLHELRATIGYVEQDAPVMAGSLRENLEYSMDGTAEEDLRDVLEVTRLQPLLRRLGGDLDAPIQYRGVSLSGGERQRIAIARALLRRPRLLLLDEATSQLDAVNEAALREVVRSLSTRVAVLAVAHRLSTVRSATRIAVVQDGRVRATGTHEELMHSSELYAQLASHQLTPH